MALKIQLRRGTAAEWTSANPVLMQGEMGVETDTLKVKLGNGTTAWTSLPYFTQGVKGDTGATGATGPQGAKGEKGDIGDTGPANTLTVGTVTTGAAGSNAVVTIAGSAPNQTISFTIPQGIQGIQGIQGVKGDTGTGVPSGGTTGQVVVKTVSGTAWKTPALPDNSDVEITSPADKQVLQYEASTSKWKNKVASGGVTVSESTPASPIDGDAWFYADDGTLFVRYNDGNSTQWVQPNAVLSSQIEQRYFSPNVIINGAFDIWQRGTSFTAIGYNADRFRTDRGSSDSFTVTQQVSTPDSLPVPGFGDEAFFHRVAFTTANQAGSYGTISQLIEDVRTFAGQTVTFSFYAKADSVKSVGVEFIQNFGSGGSAAVTGIGTVARTLSSGWARYSVTTTLPNLAGRTIGAGSNLQVAIWVSSGSTFASRASNIANQSITFDSWGWQLEAGATASPFRRNANSLQGELAACQRYYLAMSGNITNGYKTGADTFRVTVVYFPVQMRIAPTVSAIWSDSTTATSNGTNTNSTIPVKNMGNTTTEIILTSLTASAEL